VRIPNLSASIITSGTLDPVRIPNLDAGKITTGTLVVGRTQAKCTDAAADQTSLNKAADTAKTQGSTIIVGGYIGTSFLTASNIQTGTLNASLITVTNLSATSITTGTLTGRRVQTASSGARTVMNGTYSLEGFNASDLRTFYIEPSTGNSFLSNLAVYNLGYHYSVLNEYSDDYTIAANSSHTFTIGTSKSFKGCVITMICNDGTDSSAVLKGGGNTRYTAYFSASWSRPQCVWIPPTTNTNASEAWTIVVANQDNSSRECRISAAY